MLLALALDKPGVHLSLACITLSSESNCHQPVMFEGL